MTSTKGFRHIGKLFSPGICADDERHFASDRLPNDQAKSLAYRRHNRQVCSCKMTRDAARDVEAPRGQSHGPAGFLPRQLF
jgi:hypothetical protein